MFVSVLWGSVSKTLFICQFSRWWDSDEDHITMICGWLVSRENCFQIRKKIKVEIEFTFLILWVAIFLVFRRL